MKARLSLNNYDSTFNDECYIYVHVAGIPSKGSCFYLKDEDKKELVNLITKDHEIAYIFDIYYYGINVNNIDFKDFEQIPLSKIKKKAVLSDFIYVTDIGFHWNKIEYELWIVLSKTENPEY